MRTKALVLSVLAASVLLVGAAGAVAAQPEDAGESGDAGPPEDLPEQVPDFVSGIHDAVRDFLGGTIDSLGEAVSDLTPGGDAGDNGTASNDTDA